MTGNETRRQRWQRIIFGTDTPAGRLFDALLIITIIASVLAVMIDSVERIHNRFGHWLYMAEWFFTLLFTAEYAVRLWVSDRPLRYARSFFGIVDLVAVLPTYLSLLLPGANYLLTIRVLRVLRVFRVLRLVSFMREANILAIALGQARRKVAIFMFTVLIIITVFGSLMYVIEGPAHGFTSIPTSIYWAIVTITTVGYGDISPHTPLGQAIASLAMLTGYAIIAVPTGIITAEIATAMHHDRDRFKRECRQCHLLNHETDAHYCRRCGAHLPGAQATDSPPDQQT